MVFDTAGELGTILGIWAHPDDEAWLSAGLMATAVDAGRRVVCVTATRGEAGFPADDDRSPTQRAAVRETEMTASLAILGVTEHRYLGYPDGGCAQVPDEEAVTTLADVIADVRPDTVLTFGPDGATGHQDHIAACRWTTMAFARAAPARARLLYATKTREWEQEFMAGIDPATIMMVPDLEPESVDSADLAVWFSCGDAVVARKVAALRAQVSQIERFVLEVGIDLFTELVREEFYREPRPGDAQILDRLRRR